MAPVDKDNKVGLGPRIAAYLRERYLDHRAKRISADFRVSVGTAKRWLAGIAPTPASIEEMASRWGSAFIAAAFADYIAQKEATALTLVVMMENGEAIRDRDRQRRRELAEQTSQEIPDDNATGDTDLDIAAFLRRRPEEPWREVLKELLAKIPPPSYPSEKKFSLFQWLGSLLR